MGTLGMHGTARRFAIALVALGGLATLGAGAAQASQVSVAGNTITLVDSASQPNFVFVNWGNTGTLPPTISDNAGAVPTPPCEEEVVGIICPAAGRPAYVVRLGGGDDTAMSINEAAAGSHTDLLGEAGNDGLQSGDGSDTLDGGPDADTLSPDDESSSPGDIVRGGSGSDLLQLAATFAPTVVATLDGKADDGGPGNRDNYATDIENVTGSQVARNTIVGSGRANVIQGQSYDDRLAGAGGKDTITALGGNDTVDALDGAGGDRVDCGDGADVAYLDSGDVATSNCERRTVAPGISSSRLRYRSKRIRVSLSCPRSSRTTCAGSLRLSAKGKTIAKASYRVRRGVRATVSLKPRKRPAAKVSATLTVAPKGRTPVAGRGVTIRR